MVAYQAVGVHQPIEAAADIAKNLKKHFAVRVREINVLAAVATRGDVVQGAGELKSKWLAIRQVAQSEQKARPDPDAVTPMPVSDLPRTHDHDTAALESGPVSRGEDSAS